MATVPPPPPRATPPGEPSNRWPWVALGLGLLVIAAAAAVFFINRQRDVNVNVASSPALGSVATGTVLPGPSPTLALARPTLAASATPAPSATPAASPTLASPTRLPASPTPLPAPTPPTPVEAATPQPVPTPPPPTPPVQAGTPQATPAADSQQPGTAAAPAASAQPTQLAAAPSQAPAPTQPAATVPPIQAASTPPSAPTPAPSATAFAGQVAGPGGLGNTRADADAAFGAPVGETPQQLVVYRKATTEYHVRFVPDSTGREALLVGLGQPQALTLEQAAADAHRLLPRDAQPPSPQQEGNPQFVVERLTSQALAQALPADVFTANKGQPGELLIVYVRDPAQATRVSRFIVGPGSDPNALVAQGR